MPETLSRSGQAKSAHKLLRTPEAIQATPLWKLRAAMACKALGDTKEAFLLWCEVMGEWREDPAAYVNLIGMCGEAGLWELAQKIRGLLPASFWHLQDAELRRQGVIHRNASMASSSGVLPPFYGVHDLGGIVMGRPMDDVAF